jgi:NAD-dependent DNA ligase
MCSKREVTKAKTAIKAASVALRPLLKEWNRLDRALERPNVTPAEYDRLIDEQVKLEKVFDLVDRARLRLP